MAETEKNKHRLEQAYTIIPRPIPSAQKNMKKQPGI